MSIDENGYLDSDIAEWIQKHRKEHGKLFSVCDAINFLAQDNLYKLKIHSDNVQEVVVALLYIRSLSTYQTSILLIERGLVAEARITLRTLLEILFKLRAISKDRDVAHAYVYEDEMFRKKFINKFKLLSEEVKQAQGNPKVDDLLQSITKNIGDKNIKERQTQWYAQRAGLDDYYNSVYSLFSSSVHVNARDLLELVLANETGQIKEILYGPAGAQDIDKLLATAGETQALILEDVSRTFDLKLDERILKERSTLHDIFSDKKHK